MTAAWVTVAVLLLGVPLAAWWLGGRRFWSRLRLGRERDPWGDVVRRHRLSPGESARLSREVPKGTRYDDGRLRAAAVDLAQLELGQGLLPAGASRTRRVVVVLFFLWVVAVLGWIVHLVASGRPGDVNWLTFAIWAAVFGWLVARRRRLRRTVELNQPAGSDRAAD